MNRRRDQFSEQLGSLFDKGRHLREGAEENFLALVQSQLHKLDVVSREDYDALVSMVSQLEERVAELEQRLGRESEGSSPSGGAE